MANNPYVNKVVFGSATLVDLTGTTATADKILSGYGAYGADGAWMDGTATAPTIQSLSVTPSETAQTFNASGVDGYKPVSVSAVSSTYVGTGITRRSATDMYGAYDKDVGNYQVSAPAGYYSSKSWFTVPNGTIDTPTATKGTVRNHSVSITPGVFHTPGYIHGGIEEGTAVTVTASELVSGSETKTANGTYNVTNLASLVVNIPFVTYYTGSSDPSSSLGSNGDIYLKVVS